MIKTIRMVLKEAYLTKVTTVNNFASKYFKGGDEQSNKGNNLPQREGATASLGMEVKIRNNFKIRLQ